MNVGCDGELLPLMVSVVELAEQCLRGDRPEGVFEDGGDLVPIDAIVLVRIEHFVWILDAQRSAHIAN